MAAFIWEPLTSRNRYSDPEGSKSLQHPRLFSHTRRNGWHRVKGSGAGTEKGLANDLAAINRVAEPGIAVDAYRHIAEQRRFFFLPFSPSPSLSPFTLHPPSRSIPINLRSVFIAINALSLSLPFSFCPVETKNAHCGPDRWSLMSGIRFRPVEQSFVLIGNDATSLSRQPSPPLFTLLASAAIYIDVEPNRFAVQPANDRFLTGCSTLDFS